MTPIPNKMAFPKRFETGMGMSMSMSMSMSMRPRL